MSTPSKHPAFWFCSRCGMRGVESKPGAGPAGVRGVKQPSWLSRCILAAAWIYLSLAIATWLLLYGLADRWWLATALLYGPRWVCAVPLVALIPAALLCRRAFLPVAMTLLVVIGPLLGFCVPWRTWLPNRAQKQPKIRVLSCNVHYANLHPAALFDLIVATGPDIVALQEWTPRHDDPATKLGPGWYVHIDPDTCLLSRFPIEAVEHLSRDELGGKGAAVHYRLRTAGEVLHFFNLHPISPRDGLEAVVDDPLAAAHDVEQNLDVRWREGAAASRWAGQVQGRVLLAGDFNLPCESAIYRQYWSRYTDAFSVAGLGLGYTWFSHWHGVRIDHILAGAGWRCRRCWVGPDIGSDHRPLIADLEWTGD